MAFVIVSRTALVTMPIMLAVFGLMHLSWRTNLMILCAAAVVAAIAWAASPQLQWTVKTFTRDYQLYKEQGTSDLDRRTTGVLAQVAALFCRCPARSVTAPARPTGCSSRPPPGPPCWLRRRVVSNPHNQTLNVAIQWGVIGIAVLYAMWLLHLLLFRGEGLASWIGLLVVVQNIFTSLFNSHLFDFHEGWMYVLGVGVAGGMVLKARQSDQDRERGVPEASAR